MVFGDMGYTFTKALVYIFLSIAAIYGAYAIYYAYFKMKDEREKNIVLRSVANAFCILLVFNLLYFFIELIVQYAAVAELTRLWDILHFGLAASNGAMANVSNMMAVLAVCLFINKRKAGDD